MYPVYPVLPTTLVYRGKPMHLSITNLSSLNSSAGRPSVRPFMVGDEALQVETPGPKDCPERSRRPGAPQLAVGLVRIKQSRQAETPDRTAVTTPSTSPPPKNTTNPNQDAPVHWLIKAVSPSVELRYEPQPSTCTYLWTRELPPLRTSLAITTDANIRI